MNTGVSFAHNSPIRKKIFWQTISNKQGAILSFLLLLFIFPCCVMASPLLIIKSSENTAFNQAETSILDVLSDQYTIKTFNLSGNKKAFPYQQIHRFSNIKDPLAVITIGTLASKLAFNEIRKGNVSSSVPVVATMVLQPDISKIDPPHRKKMVGIKLDIPYQRQFEKIHELLPDIKKIGTLYHPNEIDRVQDAIKSASVYGIEIIAKQITEVEQLAPALEHLIYSGEIELFWPMTDPKIYSKELLQYIFLKTSQNKIPSVGPSRIYLEWGALLSFDVNYEDIGRQTGMLLDDILQGRHGLISSFYPPSQPVGYSLNLKAASEFNIIFPEKVIEQASYSIR